MADAPEPRHQSDDRLVDQLDARLREVELVVGARIMASWAEASELSLEQARLLLVLATRSGAFTARELADISGISIEDVHPALEQLDRRGDTHEEGRRYALTDGGRESIASLDAARRAGIEDYVSDLSPDDRLQLESALGLHS